MRMRKRVRVLKNCGILTVVAAVVRGEWTTIYAILYNMLLGLWEQQKKMVKKEESALNGKAIITSSDTDKGRNLL